MSESTDISIEQRADGIYVKLGDREAGPFESFQDIKSSEVAQKIGADPNKVFITIFNARRVVAGLDKGEIASDVAIEVADSFTYTGDRPFFGRIQVVALAYPQSRCMHLDFNCSSSKTDCKSECPLKEDKTKLHFEGADVDQSAFATYFDTNVPRYALRVLIERGLEPSCPAWWNAARCKGENERAVTQAIVMDRQGTEGRAWFVHGPRCDLRRAPNWIIAEGWLCKGQKGRIGVLVNAFTSDSEVAKPRPEDVEKAKEYLRKAIDSESEALENSGVWKVAEAWQRRSQLKGTEIVKGFVSDLLTIGSPVWVETPEGPPQLGATTSELGLTTICKSLREKLLVSWLGSGKYDTGRKTAAGLTVGLEKVEGMGFIARKGLLPSMDLSWCALENMPPYALDDQIESRRDGIIMLSAIRPAELWARCRLKLLGNPRQPFDENVYKCTVLKMYSSKMIARFAFAIFTYGVTTGERYSDEIMKPQPGDSELLDAAKTMLKWNLSQEITFTVPESLWPEVIKLGMMLDEKYGCEDIPLLLRSIPYKLSLVAYPFALFEGFTEPTERHIKLACKWLDFCAKDIQLDEYVEWWRSQHQLSEEEFLIAGSMIESEIAAEAKEHGGGREEACTYKIIECLSKSEKGITRDEIAAHANVEPETISVKVRLLKGLDLLKSDKDGYHFTAKGVRLFRRWIKEWKSLSGTQEKLKIVYDKAKELAAGIKVYKPSLANALKGIMESEEVNRMLAILEKEGKIVDLDQDHWKVI